MSNEQAPVCITGRPLWSWAALALVTALSVAGCNGPGAGKAGGAPATAPNETITLTFASGDPLPVDTTFATLVDQDSGGRLMLRTVPYNNRSASIDPTIAADLQKGKLDVGDVGSRAWESLGVNDFRAYQDPFLITSRELLDAAVTGPVAATLLPSLRPVGITGLAIVPVSLRYLSSTRPLITPEQFTGAKIAVNESATSREVITALGATPVTDMATGPAAVQALRDGALTAIESSPFNAVENGYVQVAPYVVVNAPLFAKTSTFAINSSQLAKLPAPDAGWLREAAQQAAAAAAASATDRAMWASACGQGLKPLAVTAQQFAVLQNAEAPTYADLSGDSQTTLAIDRIGGLAATAPRLDAWGTCRGIGIAASPTSVLDGSYETAVTQAEVVAGGQCADCGNGGTYRLVVHDGWYALYHPVQIDANPDEPSVSFFQGWGPADPVEVGTISVAGNRLTTVPEVNQQNGSGRTVYTFELFHGLLTLHQLSGNGWDTSHPWRQLN